MRLEWKPAAYDDRERIMDFIALDNPQAAIETDALFKKTADTIAGQPKLFKVGRMKGTREAVAHPSYILVYQVSDNTTTILRVLHTSQAWPV